MKAATPGAWSLAPMVLLCLFGATSRSAGSDIQWFDDATHVRLLVHEVGLNQMQPYRGDMRYLIERWRSRTPENALDSYRGVHMVLQSPFGANRMPASFYVVATSFRSLREVATWEDEIRVQMVEDLRSTEAWDRAIERVDHQYRLVLERRSDLSSEAGPERRKLSGSSGLMTTRLFARPGGGAAMERALEELLAAYRAGGDSDPVVVYEVIEGNSGHELLLVTSAETSLRFVYPPPGVVDERRNEHAMLLRKLRNTVMRYDQRISHIDDGSRL